MAEARPISLAALTVLEVTPPEMISIAKACGYSHVGLRAIAATPNETHFPVMRDAALRRETLARLDATGIGVLDVEILRLTPQTKVQEFEAVLEFGAQCSARFALVAGNDDDPSRLGDNLSALGALASGYGIVPHVEFMPWTAVPNLGAAISLVERSDSPVVGVLVDAFHLNRSGSKIDTIPPNDPRFGYLQLCDIAGPTPDDMDAILTEARSDRLFPGQGDCLLVALLQRLNVNTPISIEVPADRLRAKGVTALERAEMAIQATQLVLKAAGYD